MENTREIVTTLLLFLGQSREEKMVGVQLAALIRHKFPDFSPGGFQCKNLREFIRQYAPEIAEVGRSGADIVYGLQPVVESISAPLRSLPVASPRKQIDPFIWRAFTNPGSGYRVHANLSTGELKSVALSVSPMPDSVVLQPASDDTQVAIARDFAGRVPDTIKRLALLGCLGRPAWWTAFFATAIEHSLEVEWGRFRRRRLQEEFVKTLRAAKIPEVLLAQSPEVDKTPPPPPTQAPSPSGTVNTISAVSPVEDRLRRIVVDVVKRLPLADLRALRLPVGDVLDVVAELSD